jgi:sortase A
VEQVLRLVDRILAEPGRRRHVFGWLKAPGGGTEDWLPVDAYYPGHRLVVVCSNSSTQHDAAFKELVPAHGLRLLEVQPSELGPTREEAIQTLSRRIEELGASSPTGVGGAGGQDGSATATRMGAAAPVKAPSRRVEAPPQPVGTPSQPDGAPPRAQRPRMDLRRRLLRDLSLVLVISGVLLLADAAATLLWQEPLSAVIALIEQGNLDRRLLGYQGAPLTHVDVQALGRLRKSRERVAFLARQEQRVAKRGDAIGTIYFPKLGNQYTVVQGTDDASLQRGPGHYPQTVFPGLGQTVAIAGHRTTYLAPFRRVNELQHGDKIVLTLRYARFTYFVQHVQIVTPTSWWIIKNHGYERLVLSACNPLYSAAQRIVVFARKQSVVPLGPAVIPGPSFWTELKHVFKSP